MQSSYAVALAGPVGWARRLGVIGAAEPSLFESLFPRATVVHKAIAAALFIALIAGLARVRFHLPDNPVPITLQTLGVLSAGALFGWRWGLVTVVGYYLVGMAEVPVFQGGGNGWTYVKGTSGGYLLGFILAAGIVGYMTQRGWSRDRALWPIAIGAIAVYVPALIWLSVFDLGWPAPGKLFSSAVYPYIPGDLLKLMSAGLLTSALWRVADWRLAKGRKDTNTPVR